MHDPSRTYQEVIEENALLKQRIQELEQSELALKRAEKALRESEAQKNAILNGITTNIAFVNSDLKILWVNKTAAESINKSPDEMVGHTCHELWADPSIPCKDCPTLKSFQTQKSEHTIMRTPDERIWDERGEPVFDTEGKMIGVVEIAQDITDRKRVEQELRESEGKYRLLAENSTDVIWTMSLDGRFTYVSPSVTIHAGYTQEEAMAMSIDTYMYKEDLPWVMELLYQELQKPRGERTERRTLEVQQYKKDGSLLDVEVSVSWLYDEHGETIGLQGSTRDITTRKQAEQTRRKLEEQLAQAQKMESIGTLAGGIAHDFNNLLMGIQGYASLMLMDINADHPHHEKLLAIEKQVASGADLTRQLLGFARGGRYEIKPTVINDLLAKAAAIFGRTKKEIRIHEKYCEDLQAVEVDQGQMDQVLLNLFVNAWQAMPGGGDLFLETDNVHLDNAFVAPYEINPGPYVKFSVTDTGVGMNENTMQRIFDPFFTTREIGRGTGLGLAMVYGIVKGHGGKIHVDSELGHGTTFTIYLPVSEKAVEKEKKASNAMARGKETILLVDDEEIVLEVGRKLLESLGYGVYVARNGQQAIEGYLKNHKAIDLVILDMIMPGISGEETFYHLREINPYIRVLLSSGYSIDGLAQQILDRGCNGFLQKPFRLEVLSQKIREILG